MGAEGKKSLTDRVHRDRYRRPCWRGPSPRLMPTILGGYVWWSSRCLIRHAALKFGWCPLPTGRTACRRGDLPCGPTHAADDRTGSRRRLGSTGAPCRRAGSRSLVWGAVVLFPDELRPDFRGRKNQRAQFIVNTTSVDGAGVHPSRDEYADVRADRFPVRMSSSSLCRLLPERSSLEFRFYGSAYRLLRTPPTG